MNDTLIPSEPNFYHAFPQAARDLVSALIKPGHFYRLREAYEFPRYHRRAVYTYLRCEDTLPFSPRKEVLNLEIWSNPRSRNGFKRTFAWKNVDFVLWLK